MPRKRLLFGVTPLCVVRTRATGQDVNRFVQEHLNGTSAGPIGLLAQCDGVPTVQTGDDTLMPCPPLVRVFPTQCLRRAEEHGEVRMRWAAQCQPDNGGSCECNFRNTTALGPTVSEGVPCRVYPL